MLKLMVHFIYDDIDEFMILVQLTAWSTAVRLKLNHLNRKKILEFFSK